MSTTSSKNFTTLYSGSGSVTPQAPYGNANVVGLLAAGTDGANTVGNITATGAVNTTGTMSATGNITTAGYFVGNFAGNITGNLTVPGSNTQVLFNNQGNAGASANFTFNDATDLLSVTGNVQANYFVGNGSQLTGIAGSYSNADVSTYLASGTNTSNIITTANVAGNYFIGNGSQLTGITTNYSNANVTSLLASFGSNTISSTGNITTTANIAGNYILGNGALLTGIAGTYGNADVSSYLASGTNSANITTSANISGNFILGNGSQLTGLPATYGNANVSAYLASGTNSANITTSANIAGNFFIGNGSQLTGITGASLSGNLTGNLEGNTYGANAFAFVSATGNISSNQQAIIGTANATASATGNIVVSGKNIATDVVFAPDVSTTSTPAGGRILIGAGVAGNTSLLTYDNNNQLRGTRLAIMDSYTKNNSAVISAALKSWQAVALDGNITLNTARIQGTGTVLNVGGGAAGNTMLPTHNVGVATNGLAGTTSILNLGGATANLISVVGGNLQTAYATGYSSLMNFFGANSYTGNAVGFQSTMITNNTTSNIRNAVGYSVAFSDLAANTTGVGNTVGYLFPDQTTSYGASVSGAFTKGNLLAFLNVGNLAQVRLGSTLEQHYYAYPVPTTTGNVTINSANGQVQTVTPTGAMAITDVTNLITNAYNNSLAVNTPQSQSVTVQIRQGATGYAVTLPATLSGGPVAYADGFNTVSTTAYSSTFVTFYSNPVGTGGGSPIYAEVKTSDAGGAAAGNDGMIQFNTGGVSITGGRLNGTGNLLWSNTSQTLTTYNANVNGNLNVQGGFPLTVAGNIDVRSYIVNGTPAVNKTMTVSANAALSSTQARFGSTSLGLQASGNSYVSTPNSAEFAPGTGAFTVEAFVNPTIMPTGANQAVVFDTGEAGSAFDFRPQIFFEAGNVVYSGYNYTNDITANVALTANTWTHLAVQRSANITTLFINGANVGAFTDTYNYNVSTGNVRVGATTYDAVPAGWSGYVDEFRWSNVARYSGSGFTVPSSPFGTDGNTVLLLHFDGANGQTTTLDSSSTSDVLFGDNINVNGDVSISGQYFGSGASLTNVRAQSVNVNIRNYWANNAGALGQIVCVSNSPTQAGKMAYWSITSNSWRYIADDTAI